MKLTNGQVIKSIIDAAMFEGGCAQFYINILCRWSSNGLPSTGKRLKIAVCPIYFYINAYKEYTDIMI